MATMKMHPDAVAVAKVLGFGTVELEDGAVIVTAPVPGKIGKAILKKLAMSTCLLDKTCTPYGVVTKVYPKTFTVMEAAAAVKTYAAEKGVVL